MLGRAVMARFGDRAIGGDLPEVDITRPEQVRELIETHRPASIINCAAWTDVDGAESHPEEAMRLNGDAVGGLARVAAETGTHLIAISTDYVFTGEGSEPWPEEAPESAFGPLSVYGQTKLEGERQLRAAGGAWCLARTQWLYGAGGKNFVDTIATLAAERESLRVVDDQIGAPTWTVDLAGMLALLVEHRATGPYHCVNSGYVSWHGIACHIVERLGFACRVEPCSTDEFPRPARRPFNSRLDQSRLIALAGAPQRPWQEALDAYLATR